ncbi:hypothetical protein K2X33_15420, partial [bacterium]|nr:hypothetical protein [bacterium]
LTEFARERLLDFVQDPEKGLGKERDLFRASGQDLSGHRVYALMKLAEYPEMHARIRPYFQEQRIINELLENLHYSQRPEKQARLLLTLVDPPNKTVANHVLGQILAYIRDVQDEGRRRDHALDVTHYTSLLSRHLVADTATEGRLLHIILALNDPRVSSRVDWARLNPEARIYRGRNRVSDTREMFIQKKRTPAMHFQIYLIKLLGRFPALSQHTMRVLAKQLKPRILVTQRTNALGTVWSDPAKEATILRVLQSHGATTDPIVRKLIAEAGDDPDSHVRALAERLHLEIPTSCPAAVADLARERPSEDPEARE